MSPHCRRRRPSKLRRLLLNPGSHRDRRHSAQVARYLALFDAAFAGLSYVAFPDLATSGNLAYVRELMPLQVWGGIWLAAALSTFARRRELGQALLAITYGVWAIGTGVTYFTGDMDAPTGPVRAMAMAGLFWWFRARAVARSAGTLHGDDLALRDDDEPAYARRRS